MDMTEQDRQSFAARLLREQAVRFDGIAKRAYTAAGVNSATWTRAISGESIKAHSRHQIVARLWPETEGDWTRIPAEPTARGHLSLSGSVGGVSQDREYVAFSGDQTEAGVTDDQVLREIRAMRDETNRRFDDTNRRLDELSERVAKLEEQGS